MAQTQSLNTFLEYQNSQSNAAPSVNASAAKFEAFKNTIEQLTKSPQGDLKELLSGIVNDENNHIDKMQTISGLLNSSNNRSNLREQNKCRHSINKASLSRLFDERQASARKSTLNQQSPIRPFRAHQRNGIQFQ